MSNDFKNIPLNGDNGLRIFGEVKSWENIAWAIAAAGGKDACTYAINKEFLIQALRNVTPNGSGAIIIKLITKENNRDPMLVIRGMNGLFLLCGMEE